MALILCPHCDSWVDEHNDFCPKCGGPIRDYYSTHSGDETEIYIDNGSFQGSSKRKPDRKKDDGIKWKLIVAAEVLAAVIIIAVVCFSFVERKNEEEANLKARQQAHREQLARSESDRLEKQEAQRIEAEKQASADRTAAFYAAIPKASKIFETAERHAFLKSSSDLRKFFRSKGYTLVKEGKNQMYNNPDYGVSFYSYWKYRISLINNNKEIEYCEATVYEGYSTGLTVTFSSSSLTKNFVNSVKSYVGKPYGNPYGISNQLDMSVNGNTVYFYLLY